MARRNNSGGFGFNGIFGMIFTIALIYVLFKVFSIAASLLWFIGPILLVVAFFLNRSVVTKFFKSIITNFKTKPMESVGKALLTFFAFPLVGGYLFGKAVIKNKVAEVTGQMKAKEPEFTEYEDVTDTEAEIVEDDDFLDISELEQQLEDLTVKENKPPTSSSKSSQAKPESDPNKYDNLFD